METFFKYGNFLLEVSGSFWKSPNPNLELGSFGALYITRVTEYFTVVNRKRKEGVFQTRATDHLVDAGTMDTNITC